MLDEVWFRGRWPTDEFLLLPAGRQPFHWGQYQKVELEQAIRAVVFEIANTMHPNWRLLNALGIDDHPLNINHEDLELMVSNALRGFPRLQLLRRIPAASQMPVRTRPTESAPAPAAKAVVPRSYVGVEVASEDGGALPGVAIELTLPDGSVRTLVTEQEGQALVEQIEPGSCKIALPKLDATRWKTSEGANTVVRTEPAKTHVVQQGECLSHIAHQYGYDDWQKLWDDDKNAALKSKRKSPHVLRPGDELALPGLEVGQIERATDATHRIIVRTKPSEVEVVLTFKDSEGEPLKDEPYELTYKHAGKNEKRTGALDGSGQLREKVPVTVRVAGLVLTNLCVHRKLAFGRLDPTQDGGSTPVESGVYARLVSLGFGSRKKSQGPHSDLRAAVLAFQALVMRLKDPTGELDEATCSKLEEQYGV